ncbi:c-type cytochrome [Sphingopyxis panaciterrulae]|jgi:cytochrome c oxidase cbb3-type subunit 3|uniref:Cytochrome c oxidase cbb3-type subunit 3 n=1 Tax=Sphingopyxis panaciterrulae TaxID=462372 RepID=A0A7W9EQY0_9SPHN|nr:cytochrome c [Sphingopyxis panaciterrulae]MBB5705286.1 cytochrome c oxidase cbb3-type subunit 3 [Sphingopyxis panaciterrulae]
MIRFGIAMLGLVAMTGAIAVHQPATAGSDNPRIAASAHLYDTYCAQCHGVQRNGKGVNTVGLSVQPRDHSDTAGMSSLPRDQMIKAISEGGGAVNKSALMPSWSAVLSKEQIEDMADYLIYVCKCDTAQ